ncbi:hypothetical protein [Falsiroseomonas sp. CW058]|uniref:hypothetical protein n=1 Tax=Falsiroseomonas sp. CW058 TaxID=3388664 RepID=UPI003D3213D6
MPAPRNRAVKQPKASLKQAAPLFATSVVKLHAAQFSAAQAARPGRPRNPPFSRLAPTRLVYDPAKLVRATKTKPAFSTDEEARAELDERIRRLSLSSTSVVRALAMRLTCGDGEAPPASLAHPLYTRAFQRAQGSVLLVRTREAGAAGLEVKPFTLVWPAHAVHADELHDADPTRLIAWLRRLALKHLPRNPRGWLYAQLHGEYEARSNTFILHFHGIAAGDYLLALRGPVKAELKEEAKHLPKNPNTSDVRAPLLFQQLRDAPRQVSYVLQSWWPSRPVVMTPKGLKRVRAKRRIPEPYHSAYLVWLDRQSVAGLRLRMGLGSGG